MRRMCRTRRTSAISDLVSPSIALPAGQARLTFRNNYNLESDASSYYDGGVLEIKIGAGAFTDILAAGGSFVSGGYNGTISTAVQQFTRGPPGLERKLRRLHYDDGGSARRCRGPEHSIALALRHGQRQWQQRHQRLVH